MIQRKFINTMLKNTIKPALHSIHTLSEPLNTPPFTTHNVLEIFEAMDQAGQDLARLAISKALARTEAFKDIPDAHLQMCRAKQVRELPNIDLFYISMGIHQNTKNNSIPEYVLLKTMTHNLRRVHTYSKSKNHQQLMKYTRKIILHHPKIASSMLHEKVNQEDIQILRSILKKSKTEKIISFISFNQKTKKEQKAIKSLLSKAETIIQIRNGQQSAETLSLKERANKDIMMAVVQMKGKKLKYASEELKADKALALTAVQSDGLALEFCSESLKNDVLVVKTAVNQNKIAIQFASPDRRADRELMMTAVSEYGFNLTYASEAQKMDLELVFTAVRRHGFALQYADPYLRANRDLVIAAVTQDPLAIAYASEDLQQDPEIQALSERLEEKD